MEAEAEYALFFLGLAMAPTGLILLAVFAFRRNRRIAIYGAICLAIFVLAIARNHYAEFWDIDSCMDQGGSFNHETKQCEFQ